EYSLLFFFFQAEDGIRDFHVTGVQTCALPIFEILRCWQHRGKSPHHPTAPGRTASDDLRDRPALRRREGSCLRRRVPRGLHLREIGRASCRERVWMTGVEQSIEQETAVKRR